MNRLFASVFRARTTDEQAQQTPSYSFGERNARLLNWKLQFRRSVAGLICCALFGSYAYFWQARGWNSASRLMLTYALGDRGTVSIDGLQEQTGDRAFLNPHFSP